MNAFLMLCHTPPIHLATLAMRHPDAHYYVHYDARASWAKLGDLPTLANVHFVRHRIAVHWGGFSMVEAMLALMQSALANPHHHHFHFISGQCAPLQTPEYLSRQCTAHTDNAIWLHSENRPDLRYRTRFNAPHADTHWQRHLTGKLLTRALKILDKCLPSQQICWAGSQWFSANRGALRILFQESLGDVASFFEKKLVPDEHFFQYIVEKNQHKFQHINNNHRHIHFTEHANHPDFLTLDDLWAAQRAGFWFARKVAPEHLARWLNYEKNL